MYKDYKVLATICARGGSKGVKNKNIRELNGKPLIIHSLDLIKESKIVDEYVFSTDSEDIIDIVKRYGFKIHFKRPDHLAGDKVSRIEPIRHAVTWAEENMGTKYDVIVDIGVATPLKNSEDMDNSIKLLIDTKCKNILSVTPADRNPYYNMVEEFEGKIRKVKELSTEITDRKDAPSVYNMNDAFNVWWKDNLFSENPQFSDETKIYVMPRERSVDIDEEIDFKIAELLSGTKAGVLAGKNIIVVGGCGLLGDAFVKAIVENGGHCIVADINIKEKKNDVNISYEHVDITEKGSISKMIEMVFHKYKQVDALVNTSYPRNKNWGRSFEEVEFKDFCENIDMHLGGYFLVAQQIAVFFKKHGGGNIINIASIQGLSAPKFDTYKGITVNGKPMTSPVEYSAIKAGIINMTRYMAKYYKGCNIRCNCISPGGILAGQPEEFLDRYKDYCINKGMLNSDDFKGTLVYLLSDMSKYVNGQNIIVDDGWSL